MEPDICRFLDWDSRFFGFPIAQVNSQINPKINQGRLDSGALESIMAWCSSRGIRCLYFGADGSDAATVELAEHNDFHLVDVRLRLARPIESNGIMPPRIRPWCERDLPLLAAIARISHRDTRFYFDRGFSSDRCDDLYDAWIRNSCAGYADAVLIADVGETAGYISCHLDANSEGRIGLAAVGAAFQGQHLGSDLVQAALHWFASKGVSSATVVTQGRNIAAQRLYQQCGFRTVSTQLFYHRWFEHQEARA